MSTPTAFDRIREALDKFGPVKRLSNGNYSAQCPAHEDRSPSLSVRPIDGQVLLHCHAGCDTVDVLAALGMTLADLYDNPKPRLLAGIPAHTTYTYDNGRQVIRSADKQFRQAATDNPPELFRLGKVRAAVAAGDPVYVVEGEKDVLALESVGATATCSPMGAGKWDKVDPSPLYGANVVIITDNDGPGLKHAAQAAASLAGHGNDPVVVQAKTGKDAADHVAAGYGVDEFEEIGDLNSLNSLMSQVTHDESATPMVRPVLADAAYQGLPGRVVRAIEPHTEADPAALLATFLAAAGAMLGREAHTLGGDAEHAARLWPLIIGATAGGMKGTSWAAIRRVILAADLNFSSQITSGLSSGEGLIEHVRDGEGADPDAKDYIEGVSDKRLIIVESEFSGVLGKARREGNVLTQTLRDAWDGTRLSTLTRKSSKLVATGHHVVIIGHVTPTELRASLSESDLAGGLMNRFLPVHSHRSKKLPDGGSTPSQVVEQFGRELADVIQRNAGGLHRTLRRDTDAEALWCALYDELTPDNLPDGPLAQVVARGVPQVLRLSLTYALLDGTGDVIRREHLAAAVAVWRYVEASARMTFGDINANRDLNKLAAAIDQADNGLTRNEIVDLFARHRSQAEIDELLRQLLATGGYQDSKESTGGRPTVRYFQHRARDKREKRDKPPAATGSEVGDRDNSLSSLISQPIRQESAEPEVPPDPPESLRPCGHPLTSTPGCLQCILAARPDGATREPRLCPGCLAPWNADDPFGLCGKDDSMHRDVEQHSRKSGAVAWPPDHGAVPAPRKPVPPTKPRSPTTSPTTSTIASNAAPAAAAKTAGTCPVSGSHRPSAVPASSPS